MSKHAHEHLQELIDANSKLCDQRADLQRTIENLKIENAQLKAENSYMLDRYNNDFRSADFDKCYELNEAKVQIKKLEEDIEQFKRENLSLKAEISYLNDQNERLSNQLKGLRQKNADEVEELRKQNASLVFQFQESKEVVDKLRSENSKRYFTNERHVVEKRKLEEECEKLKKEIEALRYENKMLFDRNHAFNEKIAALEREKEQLTEQHKRLYDSLHKELEIQPGYYIDDTEEKSNFIIDCRRNWDEKQAAAFYNTLSLENKIALCEALGLNHRYELISSEAKCFNNAFQELEKIKQFYVEKIKNA